MTVLRALLAIAAAVLPMAAAAQAITVSAAASLTEALREIGPRFEATRPGVTVRFNFAASGVLIQQIVQGAPVDVFVSADAETVDRGVQQRVLDPRTRREVARNVLVMVTPAQGAPALAGPADLASPAVKRVALGKTATVPAGRYAREALEAARAWSAVEPKVVFADSVRQVLDYVARGEVEAGFVYRTDAERMRDRVRVVATLDGHAPVSYPAAVVADSRHPALAAQFVAFLASPPARALLAKHGFGTP